VIPANDKKYARIACIRIVTEILAANVDLSPPPLDERAIDEVKAVLGGPAVSRRRRAGGTRPAARPPARTTLVASAVKDYPPPSGAQKPNEQRRRADVADPRRAREWG
jgi:hypothetical protein